MVLVASHPLKPSFNAGELSPRLAARTDLDKYANGVEVLENMIPLSEGGAMRRAGTRYVAGTKTQTEDSRLVPFKFSTTQAYGLEFGDNYVRFYKDQGQIAAGATDASIANGVFTDGSSEWTDSSSLGGTTAWSSSDGSLEFTLTSSSDTAASYQAVTVSSSRIRRWLSSVEVTQRWKRQRTSQSTPRKSLSSIAGTNSGLRK